MAEMTNTTTTTTQNTASLSGLIAAGEDIFTAITGKSSANMEKVTAGLSTVADGSLPFIESKVSFDLARVIAGATGIFSGIALVLTGLKRRSVASARASASETATNAVGTGITGQAATGPARAIPASHAGIMD